MSSITATPGHAAVAYWRRARASRFARKTNLPHRYAVAATLRAFGRVGAAEGFVSVATGLYPAKAATAPGPGIIIEFLPTDPCQTAKGDASPGPQTERHKD